MECASPGANPDVNYGLWVIMMSQWRFTIVTKVMEEEGGIWDISEHSSEFCYEPKIENSP